MRKISPIFLILGLVILGGLIFGFCEVWAQASSTTATVQVDLCVNRNETIEGDEQCDGSNLNGQSCVSLGYKSGDLGCEANCTFDVSGCTTVPSAPGRGSGWVPPPPATVILQGKAYPNALLTVLKHGKVVATFEADPSASFEKEITGLLEGTYIFGLWAEDEEGRRSVTASFPISVLYGMTAIIKGIFIAPTIELEEVRVAKGEVLNILGQTVPQSEVSIFIVGPTGKEIVKTTKAKANGDWFLFFDTSVLKEDSYTIRAQAISPEKLVSSVSYILNFYIKGILGEEIPEEEIPEEEIPGVVLPNPDLNKDGRVNLIDFSILLYWWEKYDPDVDINQDGIIDLIDFSTMMYHWTG